MLKTEIACEIGNLLREIQAKSGKPYSEVEKALFDCRIWPESRKTFLTTQFGPILHDPGYEWLEEVLQSIFAELKINGIYVTEAI